MESSQGNKPEASEHIEFVEIRCHKCGKMFTKLCVERLTDSTVPVAKIFIETRCRDTQCKKEEGNGMDYKVFVV